MPAFRDISGQRFGRLVVIDKYDRKHGGWRWLCQCDCGGTIITASHNLVRNQTQSCGCYYAETRKTVRLTHGQGFGKNRTKTYRIWVSMRQRCNNPRNSAYKYYGGRGIAVCDRWQSYKDFFADMGACPVGYSIERIDNDGDYDPQNCKWIPRGEQWKNTRRGRDPDGRFSSW